jgi:hypothetical protein
MSCRDLFGLGVRLFGAWLITRGLIYVEGFADFKMYPNSDRAFHSAAGHLIYATLDFGLAAFFLLWTRLVVAWTYGDEAESDHERPAGVEGGTGGELDESERLDGP